MRYIPLFLFWTVSIWSLSPTEAFDRLLKGNQRYTADQLENPDRSVFRRREIQSKQTPFATIVGCSDSRVPPEIVFDQGLGDLFTVRVAGEVVGPIELDSIEYSVKYLGSALILVLGHQSCGAVEAVFSGNTGDIEDVARLIQPAIQKAKTLEVAIQDNVKYIVNYLKKTPLVQKYMREGKVNVVGGYYDLSDGHVEIISR